MTHRIPAILSTHLAPIYKIRLIIAFTVSNHYSRSLLPIHLLANVYCNVSPLPNQYSTCSMIICRPVQRGEVLGSPTPSTPFEASTEQCSVFLWRFSHALKKHSFCIMASPCFSHSHVHYWWFFCKMSPGSIKVLSSVRRARRGWQVKKTW